MNNLKLKEWIVFATFIGFFMVAGTRIADWVIPEKPTKIYVCFKDNNNGLDSCKPLVRSNENEQQT